MKSITISSTGISKRSQEAIQALHDMAILILELHPCPGSSRLRTLLSDLFDHLRFVLWCDAGLAIPYCKELVQYLVFYLRGQKGDIPITSYYWNYDTGKPLYLEPILAWIDVYQYDHRLLPIQRARMLQVIFMLLSCHRVVQVEAPKLKRTQLRKYHSLIRGQSRASTVTIPMKALNTILKPGPANLARVVERYQKYIPQALANLGINPSNFRDSYREEILRFRPYTITSSGPNGPAMWNGYKDAYAFMKDRRLVDALDNFFGDWGETDGFDYPMGSPLFGLMLHIRAAAKKAGKLFNQTELSRFVTGRLHAINELGGKVRVVAIVDYWSQMFLSPLHDTIAYFMKALDQDGTFDQKKVANRVRDWVADDSKEVYSFDLSAATDRLPRLLQERVLGYLLTDDMAAGWAQLMTSRSFATPGWEYARVMDRDSKYPPRVEYAVGQPMGAKSSFPMLALTHHVIVQIAALSVGKSGFKDYVILGDDNTIADPEVARAYLEIMNALGVEISLPKSYVHHEGAISAGEICKRLYIGNIELSALNPKVMTRAYFKSSLVFEFQDVLEERGMPIHESVFYEFIGAAFGPRALSLASDLNSAPAKVSGLRNPIFPSHMPNTLAERLGVTDTDLVDAYTYVSIVQQLKRLDQLIKATFSLNRVMAKKAGRKNLGWKEPFMAHRIKPVNPKVLVLLPALGDPHPIALAETSEFIRVLKVLGDMLHDPGAVIGRAKNGMLDSLRNTLTSVWLDPENKAVRVEKPRTLFFKTIDTVQAMTHNPAKVLSYETYLTSMSMSWCTYWSLGRGVHLFPGRFKLFAGQLRALSAMDKLTESLNFTKLLRKRLRNS